MARCQVCLENKEEHELKGDDAWDLLLFLPPHSLKIKSVKVFLGFCMRGTRSEAVWLLHCLREECVAESRAMPISHINIVAGVLGIVFGKERDEKWQFYFSQNRQE